MKPENADTVLLNLALNLSLEFGADWRKPVSELLVEREVKLGTVDARALGRFVEETRDWAHAIVARSLSSSVQDQEAARERIREAHPWIDEATLGRLWSQGCYYAMK